MILKIEWTKGIEGIIRDAFSNSVSVKNDIILEKISDTREQVDAISSTFDQLLVEHATQNISSFLSYDTVFLTHTQLPDMAALQNRLTGYLTRVRNYTTLVKDIVDASLTAHVQEKDPHPQYLLISEIGYRVPPLSNGVVPLSYCPSDVVGTSSFTNIKSQGYTSDKFLVSNIDGKAYGYSVSQDSLQPFTIQTVSSLPTTDDSLAISSQLAYNLAESKQNYSPILTMLSNISSGEGYLVFKGSSFGTSSITPTLPLKNVSAPYLNIVCTVSTVTPKDTLGMGESTSPGTSLYLSRSDHIHKANTHNHPWEDVSGASTYVINTVLSGVSNYTSPTILSESHTVEQSIGFLNGQLGLINSQLTSATGSINNTLSSYATVISYGDTIAKVMGGTYTKNTTLISNSSGVATSSSISTAELNALYNCNFDIQQSIDSKHDKIYASVTSRSHEYCPTGVASWTHFTHSGETGTAWGYSYVCLTDIRYCKENVLHFVTRGGYHALEDKVYATHNGIILQGSSDPNNLSSFTWYHGSYVLSGENNILVASVRTRFIRSGNIVFIMGY